MKKVTRNVGIGCGGLVLAFIGFMLLGAIITVVGGETGDSAFDTTTTTSEASTTDPTEAPPNPATTTTTTQATTTAPTTTTKPTDIIAENACRHFFNVANDAAQGLLTDAELREKLREVMDDAKYADSLVIATAARDMFAAITAGDMDGLEASALLMTIACEEL